MTRRAPATSTGTAATCGPLSLSPSLLWPLSRAAGWWCAAALLICSLAGLIASFHDTTPDPSSSASGSKFCHVTDFSTSNNDYHPVPHVTSPDRLTDLIRTGQPFCVHNVTDNWVAPAKWNHTYFRGLFQGHALFSSTFSTPEQPQFEEDYPNKEIYYGIFLNDPSLAELVANDYHYPHFIPENLRLYGM